jgi:hypothetical protein
MPVQLISMPYNNNISLHNSLRISVLNNKILRQTYLNTIKSNIKLSDNPALSTHNMNECDETGDYS